MRRRDFIAAIGGASTLPFAWSLAVAQPNRVRRIGALMSGDERDPLYQSFAGAFEQGLQKLGWTDGRNVQIAYRWAGGDDADRFRALASELVRLRPDVILANGAPALEPLAKATPSIPIVFTQVADPIALGLVGSMARPVGNITGFILNPPSMYGKSLELLKDVAPQLKRVGFLYNPQTGAYARPFITSAATASAILGVELIEAPVHSDSEVDGALAALAREPNGGLIVLGDPFTAGHRQHIATLAAQYRLPAIYSARYNLDDGGLVSYGVDNLEMFRQAAGYVDRILRGNNPSNLPVQAPVKYELVVNLKAAKAIGLTIPETFLLLANEVIEYTSIAKQL